MTRDTGAAGGVEEAAARLVAARRVLVTGLGTADLETAALACDLAEAVGAAIDAGEAECGRVAGPTAARIGGVTADPEELRDRADLVVVWFCPPAAAVPFLRRFATAATATGRPRRTIAVGPEPLPAAAGSCLHVAAESAVAVDLARLLQAAITGVAVPDPPAAVAAAAATVHRAIAAAGCVAFVTRHDDPVGLEPWSLAGLVRALAHGLPAFEVPLAADGAVAAEVCTWRYGGPGAVARADRLGGEFLPAECDARRLVERGEVDCILAVGPLPEAVEAAVAARGATPAVIRAAGGSLAAILAAVRARGEAGGRP